MARNKREVRIVNLVNFYNLYKQELITIEQAKANVEYNKQMLFESEMESVAKKYPAIDIEDFTQFLNETGGLKKSGKKSGDGAGHATRLNTPEAARERGVPEDKIKTYVDIVEVIYQAAKELNGLMTDARASFAIPRKKAKVSEETPTVSA